MADKEIRNAGVPGVNNESIQLIRPVQAASVDEFRPNAQQAVASAIPSCRDHHMRHFAQMPRNACAHMTRQRRLNRMSPGRISRGRHASSMPASPSGQRGVVNRTVRQLGRDALRDRPRMHPVKQVSPHQAVSSALEHIETRTSRDHDPSAVSAVIKNLTNFFHFTPVVKFVECHNRS